MYDFFGTKQSRQTYRFVQSVSVFFKIWIIYIPIPGLWKRLCKTSNIQHPSPTCCHWLETNLIIYHHCLMAAFSMWTGQHTVINLNCKGMTLLFTITAAWLDQKPSGDRTDGNIWTCRPEQRLCCCSAWIFLFFLALIIIWGAYFFYTQKLQIQGYCV